MSDELLTIACPECQAKLRAKPDALGKRIKCPKCQHPFVAAIDPPAEDEDQEADAGEEGEEAPRPKFKKKKKGAGKKKKTKQSSPLPFLIAGGVVTVALLIGGLAWAMGKGGSRGPAAPPELAAFNCRAFNVQVPKDWTHDGGARGESSQWISRVKGECYVRVRDDSSGVGDIISGNRSEDPEHPELDTVHRIHLDKKGSMKDDYEEYSEEKPVVYRTKLGNARRSSFIGKQGVFGTQYKGMRATIQSGTSTIVVLCHCPAAQWATYEPVFAKICESVNPGVPQ